MVRKQRGSVCVDTFLSVVGLGRWVIVLGGRLQVKMMSAFWTRWVCGVYEDATLAFEYSVLKFRGVMWAGDLVLEESTCTSG